ncbi:coiled-coil domain-containing protein [Geosporobacter ferrireducens]|uniref:hypothetical protein n=1 Tax=Geosporobacter ferrireducens TaxID=1424294 RepID=UPI0009F6BD54|nr:hypothetical protein [Geosporobacter ferrireducens]
MPSISKIRFTNIIYDKGSKRYNDDIFYFDGCNGAFVLENGGGKTVFVQTALQAIIPHSEVAGRKVKETYQLEGSCAHVAIEWILHERPRRYALTAVTLFMTPKGVDSLRFVHEYGAGDPHSIENIPFTRISESGKKRPSAKEEMNEYYQSMKSRSINAQTFPTISSFEQYIEEKFKIIPAEWRSIAVINKAEGGVDKFFADCVTTGQLVDNLIIPSIEEVMSGSGDKDFADTFEKQREHFKEYKRLKKQIEECTLIEEKMQRYISVYEKLHDAEHEYTLQKQEGKGLYHMACEERDQNEAELRKLQEQEQQCNEKIQIRKWKEDSLHLLLQEEETQRLKQIYQEKQQEMDQIQKRYDEKAALSQNIKLSDLREKIREEEERQELIQELLAGLDQDTDVEELQEKLLQNGRRLKGFYLGQIEELDKRLQQVRIQKSTYEKDLREYKQTIQELENKVSKLTYETGQIQGAIHSKEQEMEAHEKELLSNPKTEKIDIKLPEWKERVTELQKLLIGYQEEITLLEERETALEEPLRKKREEQNKVLAQYKVMQNRMESLQQKQENILRSLRKTFPQMYTVDNIYLKETLVKGQLSREMEKLRAEKEELLLRERIAKRFSDDYRDNQIFTGDANILNIVNRLRSQFGYLKTGTEYVQEAAAALHTSEKVLNEKYPLWATSIVVLESKYEQLFNKLAAESHKINQPVFLLSDQEAAALVNGKEEKIKDTVIPGFWNEHIHQDTFEEWKKKVAIEGEKIERERVEKERQLSHIQTIQDRVYTFLEEYPYEGYTTLEEQCANLAQQAEALRHWVQDCENKIRQIHQDRKLYGDKEKEVSMELDMISHKISAGNKYMSLKTQKQKDEEKLKQVQAARETQERVLTKHKREMDRIQSTLQDLNYEVQEQERNKTEILNLSLYLEVKDLDPHYTSKTKAALEEERKNLRDELQKKQKNRSNIERDLEECQKRRQRYEKEYSLEIRGAAYPIDPTITASAFRMEERERLIEQIQLLKEEMNDRSGEASGARSRYDGQEAVYQEKKSSFYKAYPEIYAFDVELSKAQEALDLERKELQKEQQHIMETHAKLSKEQGKMEQAIRELEIINGEHKFIHESIKAGDIQGTDYYYKRLETVERLKKGLESTYQAVVEQQGKVSREKEVFAAFCTQEIHDIRLRQMTISSILTKTDYQELLQSRNNIANRIVRTKKIAMDDIKQHDDEMNQFINHLYVHLDYIGQEIRMIPHKTRIRTEEGSKEIYQFTVPEWIESEAKEQLRKHIEWMLEQLEKDPKFRDEDGGEQYTEIKKFTEKSLQTKQLMQMIMKGNMVKIKCRKVTNDNKVSSGFSSWEESNQWSGGEKWSKNMTLFLGLMNYMAEKRQHINLGVGRTRTVIMDNPFGHASSDHVLNPVFYIAEQLGFQMIALTAHAEGSFIREYFPVVYSCRLREAANGQTSIMTYEKEIKHVYFKDHDPIVLDRLGRREQLTLFDL